jgi:chitin disaccharide deacetylase
MQPNPVLKKLGYSNHDRLVIIHTDDIGMCNASIQAFIELIEAGIISSGATMVPCAWFPSVAAFCRENPKVDLGVHLTLTSEWDNYRWTPISTSSVESGMIDSDGYFYRRSEDVQLHGDPEAVQTELIAQVEKAKSARIEITHVDTHMGTVAHPRFVMGYIQLAIQNHIPFLFPRMDEAGFIRLGLDAETATFAARYVSVLEDQGVPLVDFADGLDLDKPAERLDYAKHKLSNLSSGITHFVIHPSKDTPELLAIAPDWRSRVADFNTFRDERIREHLIKDGINVIGYKALKELIH